MIVAVCEHRKGIWHLVWDDPEMLCGKEIPGAPRVERFKEKFDVKRLPSSDSVCVFCLTAIMKEDG